MSNESNYIPKMFRKDPRFRKPNPELFSITVEQDEYHFPEVFDIKGPMDAKETATFHNALEAHTDGLINFEVLKMIAKDPSMYTSLGKPILAVPAENKGLRFGMKPYPTMFLVEVDDKAYRFRSEFDIKTPMNKKEIGIFHAALRHYMKSMINFEELKLIAKDPDKYTSLGKPIQTQSKSWMGVPGYPNPLTMSQEEFSQARHNWHADQAQRDDERFKMMEARDRAIMEYVCGFVNVEYLKKKAYPLMDETLSEEDKFIQLEELVREYHKKTAEVVAQVPSLGLNEDGTTKGSAFYPDGTLRGEKTGLVEDVYGHDNITQKLRELRSLGYLVPANAPFGVKQVTFDYDGMIKSDNPKDYEEITWYSQTDTPRSGGITVQGDLGISKHPTDPYDGKIVARCSKRDGRHLHFSDKECVPVEPETQDGINHPSYYNQYKDVEVIDITEQLNFNRGNAVKYISRAGFKSEDTEIQDLQKAKWYVEREISRLADGGSEYENTADAEALVEQMNYNRGTAVAAICHAGTGDYKLISTSLFKAVRYLDRELTRLEQYKED